MKTKSMWKRLSAIGLVLALLVSIVAGISGLTAVQAATENEILQAIDDGLAYLASVQNPDGSWSVPAYVPAKTCMILVKFQDRAYELGYAGELIKYCEHQNEVWRNAGIKTVVTPCADCYASFSVLYDKIGQRPAVEVLHITQYLEKLIQEDKLQLKNSLAK